MKTRRNFLAALFGGIVAAPVVAKAVVEGSKEREWYQWSDSVSGFQEGSGNLTNVLDMSTSKFRVTHTTPEINGAKVAFNMPNGETMGNEIKFFKVSSRPEYPYPNSIYLVKPENASHFTTYATDNDGNLIEGMPTPINM